MNRRHTEEMRNISRCEGNRTKGWQVRFEHAVFPIRRYFSDKRYGGRKAALWAAKAFRDQQALALPPPVKKPVLPGPGRIYLGTRRYLSADGISVAYKAFIAEIRIAPRKAVANNYSADRHGPTQARRMVEAWLKTKQVEQRKNYGLR